MIGTNIDMTEIKSLAEALHEEKERLHITLDAIGEGVISTDREMRITFMNPVAEQMCGWPLEMALGMPINGVVRMTNGKDGPEIENPVKNCLQEGPLCQQNTRWYCTAATAAVSMYRNRYLR